MDIKTVLSISGYMFGVLAVFFFVRLAFDIRSALATRKKNQKDGPFVFDPDMVHLVFFGQSQRKIETSEKTQIARIPEFASSRSSALKIYEHG